THRRLLQDGGMIDRGGLLALAREGCAGHPLSRLPMLWLDVPLHHRAEGKLARALLADRAAALFTVAAGDGITRKQLADVLAVESDDDSAARRVGALSRLQRHLFDERAPRGTLEGAVTVLSAPGEGRECVEIARRLMLEAERGTPFDRMAVLMRDPAPYHHLLREALSRAGVPAHFAEGLTRPHRQGRALLSLLRCKREGLSARGFVEYLSLSVLSPLDATEAEPAWVPPESAARAQALPEGDAADEAREVVAGAPVRHWERLILRAAVLGGRERWARRLDGLASELALERDARRREDADADAIEADLAELERLQAFVLPLIDRLDALPQQADWASWLHAMQALCARALDAPTRVLAALAELAPLGNVGPVGLDEVLRVLTPRLSELREPARGLGAGRVYCGAIESARGMEFSLVCVPGMAEKVFPQKVAEDPVLLDVLRGRLDAALQQNEQRVAGERLALRIAVGAASERVILSYPRVDLERARPRVPSFYGLEVLRAAEGELSGYDALMRRAEAAAAARIGWPAPTRPELAIDDAEHDLSLLHDLLRRPPDETRGAARYLLDANALLARSLRFRARRWSVRRFTPADGLVDPSPAARVALAAHRLAERPHSPTALESFADCPYRFVLRALHGLQPRPVPGPIEEIDARERGALIHAVLFELLSALRDAELLPLTEERLPAAREQLARVTAQVSGRFRDRLSPVVDRVWSDSVARIERDLGRWLQGLSGSTYVPMAFELGFGLPPAAGRDFRSRSEPVRLRDGTLLRGSIDLVEACEPDAEGALERMEGGEDSHPAGLRATDHKTGAVRVKAGARIAGGRSLQPLLYALALEQLFPSRRVEAGRLDYCTSEGGFEERVVVLDDAARAAVEGCLSTIDGAMKEGFLPAAPAQGACGRCDYVRVCGPYEELRVRRKERTRLKPLLSLREEP
ncbi:MAG: PD-(D/E)XK nuclease family protein, partial [Myxococcales bacterium]